MIKTKKDKLCSTISDRLLPPSGFDTSCFSGEYVTGETMEDEYFVKLFARRNEEAKTARNNKFTVDDPGTSKAQASNNGCESVSNDLRESSQHRDSCEPI